MRNFSKIIIFLFLSLFFPASSALAVNNINYDPKKIDIIYFYGENCPHCRNIESLTRGIEEKYKNDIIIHWFEASQNQGLFFEYLGLYGLPFEKVFTPLMFIDDQALLGEYEIRDNLEDFIKTCKEKEASEKCQLKTEKKTEPVIKKELFLSLPLVVSSAIIDSINPCAIGVLLFLIALLVGLKEGRKKIIQIGLIYIFAVFLTYYLAGLGLRTFFVHLGVSKFIIWAGSAFLVYVGLTDIFSYFKKDAPTCKVSKRRETILNKFFMKGAVASVFIGGVLVSLFELPCTGAVYLAILGLMAKEGRSFLGNIYLILYNIIFVLPLLIILFLGAFGFSAEILKKLKPENQKKLQLVTGILMIALAFLLIIFT